MNRRREPRAARPQARAAAKYTLYIVRQPAGLMDFLMRAMSGISRNKVKAILAARAVLVDGCITTRFDHPLRPGMKVQVGKGKERHEFRNPQLRLVYEDAYLLVVEKREGLLSVSTERQKERTALHFLSEYVARERRGGRAFVVHRLDRETSGLMVYAKDEKTQRTLRERWRELVTDRRYVAVVAGEMERDCGTVESWLTDRTLYVSSSPVDDGTGKFSVTHYRTVKRANGFSLVELTLETGRKNQIRVHMSDLGHPLAGDERYGSACDPLGRVALHAFRLCFVHPVTGEEMSFETPYPPAFRALVQRPCQASPRSRG